jgi:hypothetical protein
VFLLFVHFLGKSKNSNKIICYNIDFVSSILAGSYSPLTNDQIFLLEAQGNRSPDWTCVKLLCPVGVSFDSSLDKIRGCSFSGNIFIGLFVKSTVMVGGISVVSGLYNSNFSGSCVLSDNCYIWNTAMVMNAYVGRGTCVVGCGNVVGEGYTSYGTSHIVKIGNEASSGGGAHREVILSVRSSFADVCGSAFFRPEKNALAGGASGEDGGDKMPIDDNFSSHHVNVLHGSSSSNGGNNSGIVQLDSMHNMSGNVGGHNMVSNMIMNGVPKPKRAKFNKNDSNVRFDMTIICDDVELIGCSLIRNCFVGSYNSIRNSIVVSSTTLAHCEISSAHLNDSVLHQSCKALTGAQLSGVLMFPHSSVSDQAKVTDSVLGPDSSVSVGECKNTLLGPHVGFHHQALLIATSWPMGRGNISYGSMIGEYFISLYTHFC